MKSTLGEDGIISISSRNQKKSKKTQGETGGVEGPSIFVVTHSIDLIFKPGDPASTCFERASGLWKDIADVSTKSTSPFRYCLVAGSWQGREDSRRGVLHCEGVTLLFLDFLIFFVPQSARRGSIRNQGQG